MEDKDKTPNSFDIITEKLQQQEERIAALEKENASLKKDITDVTELNRALLNRKGNEQQKKDVVKPDASKKLQEYLDND